MYNSIKMKDRIDRIMRTLSEFYPEKKIFAFDTLCGTQRESLTKIAKELNITIEEILADYGYGRRRV